jgi:hypothetical protein
MYLVEMFVVTYSFFLSFFCIFVIIHSVKAPVTGNVSYSNRCDEQRSQKLIPEC